MSMNLVVLLYLVASVCFIQALKGLSHPTTSRRGNVFGMVGMLIAIVTTVALILKLQGAAGTQSNGAGIALVIFGLLVGGSAGTVMARRVEMTKMPELVAFMHSMIGLAAVFIAIACVAEPWAFNIVGHGEPIPVVRLLAEEPGGLRQGRVATRGARPAPSRTPHRFRPPFRGSAGTIRPTFWSASAPRTVGSRSQAASSDS